MVKIGARFEPTDLISPLVELSFSVEEVVDRWRSLRKLSESP